jgi:hypothetical protein
MPKRAPAKDSNTAIVRAVEAVTDSKPVKGESLLPARLKKEFREAKKRSRSAKR